MAQNETIDNVAAEHGIRPAVLAFHVRDLHGWAPGEVGFEEAVEEAATCKREECRELVAELEQSAAPEPVTA